MSCVFKIDQGNLGYINLSDFAIMALSPLFSPPYAFLMAASMTVASDLLLHHTRYLLITFVIKGLEGALASLLTKKQVNYFVIVICCCTIVLLGYSFYDWYSLGSLAGFTTSLKYNGIQVVAAGGLACSLKPFIEKIRERYGSEVH